MAVGISEARYILVIGATAGIGRALALALHDLPSKPTVIVGGRRKERLEELTKTSDRLKAVQVDVTADRATLQAFVKDTISTYQDLDAVIFSSGIQHVFDFKKPETVDLDVLLAELTTNYTSIVTLSTLFLPHFLKLSEQGRPSFLIPVSSGLAFVPSAFVPNYSATKAALHSFSISLGVQLSSTKVRVLEVIPPLVESELHDHQGTTPTLSKFWMPLSEFIEKTVAGLLNGDTQIAVGQAAVGWEAHEKGKPEKAAQLYAHMSKVYNEGGK